MFGDDVSGLVELDGDEPPDPPCLFCGCQAKPQVHLKLEIWNFMFSYKFRTVNLSPYYDEW